MFLGVITVYFSRNNVFFTLSCVQTKIITFNLSATQLGFRNLKKDSIQIIQQIAMTINESKFNIFVLKIRGINKLRNLLIKQMIKFNLNIVKIVDINVIPFNGCRLTKKRRI
jgi:ribosomal protein S11